MKPIERNEILGLGDYETIREPFRNRVILEKRIRRVQLGPKATAVFENRDTVLLQIQEMLRTERITREDAIEHEIRTYNSLLPGPRELSLTLMIEILNKDEREAFLAAAMGFEQHVSLVVDGERVAATSEEQRSVSERTTAVHYLKFHLTENAYSKLRSASLPASRSIDIRLRVDHPAYEAVSQLSAEAVQSIAQDLS